MKRLLLWMLALVAAMALKANTVGYGAWCWFADPRALHYENATGSINASWIGYIDTHGNIVATQMDFNSGRRTDVLIRSYFQPDDHNNPTFLVLPDERVMIFYTRHTDEPRIWYRISTRPGDITSLGEEKSIATKHNTTYPSPFILSDDPTHIYICWRGINWHPTIARITLPDKDDNVSVDFGPRQMVQSTGARPYAKYQSNGKDKIFLTYTTGHPDNEWPNWLYFNVVDINHGNGPLLRDIRGSLLADIGKETFHVSKRQDYKDKHPCTVVDAPADARCWVWQIATDKKEQPVVAMTRINEDKLQHKYLAAKWTGKEWRKTELADAGHAFHKNWDKTERCYSGGMAIDPANTDIFYASLPTDGKYEIWKLTLKKDGTVKTREQVTRQSAKDNARPYVLPGSERSPLRLAWFGGDYYYWMVNRHFPQGYPTHVMADYELPQQQQGRTVLEDKAYRGQTLSLGRDSILGVTADNRLYIRLKGKTYESQCRYLTSDDWARFSWGTSGDSWPTRIDEAHIKVCDDMGELKLYRNGLLELVAPARKLAWSDEFGRDGQPDDALWNHEEGFVRNDEDQWYQRGNAYQKDGLLVIEARRESRPNPTYDPASQDWGKKRKTISYTSTSLNTAGKKEFLYGRMEVRAKIPTASGAWPAIWTLGSGMEWPSCGEVDVMEFYRIDGQPVVMANAAWGNDRQWDAVWQSVATPLAHFTEKDAKWAERFHTWTMDWNEQRIDLYLDGELLNHVDLSKTKNGAIGKGSNPFHKPQYILLNLALGGQHGGEIDKKAFPMKYEIDYVRIYQ